MAILHRDDEDKAPMKFREDLTAGRTESVAVR
jgi:hypothetical protein